MMMPFLHLFGGLLLLILWQTPESAGQLPDRLMQKGLFEVAYSTPDEALAGKTLRILETATADYALHLPIGTEPVHVILCHDPAQFNTLAGRYGLRRVEGLAKPDEGIILLKTPALLSPGSDYAGIVRHELIHVLMGRNVNEANTPRWFEEGVAMLLSKELRFESLLYLGSMYLHHRIIPYAELDFAFVPVGDEESFGNAYAVALSLTQHLRRQMGDAAFWELIKALKTEPFEDALARYTGLTPLALYIHWEQSLWKVAVITSLVSGFTVFQFMAILVLIVYWRKRRQNRRVLQQWADEDALETGNNIDSSAVWWEEEETGDGDKRDQS